MPQNRFDGKSTLVQVMAWCHQATSHSPRSLSPHGITKIQWVKATMTSTSQVPSYILQHIEACYCKDISVFWFIQITMIHFTDPVKNKVSLIKMIVWHWIYYIQYIARTQWVNTHWPTKSYKWQIPFSNPFYWKHIYILIFWAWTYFTNTYWLN